MLEHAFIIALLVLAIWYTMSEGEIFAGLGRWFENNTPSFMHQPLFDCNICMTPYYGSLLYIFIYGINWEWPIVVICAMGVNVMINKLSPDK